MSPAIAAWLSAFLFTQAVEIPIYARAMRPWPRALGLKLAIAFGASAVTHPVVWFVIPTLRAWSPYPYEEMVVRAETFAVVIEGLYLYAVGAFTLRRAMLWSLLANASSASLGLLCRELFGWP
jgi:hypothetical protein